MRVGVDQAMKLGVGQGSKEQVVRVYRPGNAKLLARKYISEQGPPFD